LALLETLGRYDPAEHRHFMPYACNRIKYHLIEVIRCDRAVTIPVHTQYGLSSAERKLEAEGEPATAEEVAGGVSWAPHTVKAYRVARQYAHSLDAPYVPNGGTLYDLVDTDGRRPSRGHLRRPTEERALGAIEAEELRAAMDAAIDALRSDAQREVVRRRLAGETNPEIGEAMGVNAGQMFYVAKQQMRKLLAEWSERRAVVTYRGVSRIKGARVNKWLATIMVNRKSIYLGRFKTAKEAAVAYDRAALERHSKPRLNFPERWDLAASA
jgi:RNA polymerase sigma factor (sigma-70 family)